MSVVLDEVRKAFLNKITPKLTDSGISGSYFLENVDRNKVAIFKPLDEEPYAPNNPRGYIGNNFYLILHLKSKHYSHQAFIDLQERWDRRELEKEF